MPSDAHPAHQIVPLGRLGHAKRPTHSPLHPRPALEVLPRDRLGLCLPHVGLCGLKLPRGGAVRATEDPRSTRGGVTAAA